MSDSFIEKFRLPEPPPVEIPAPQQHYLIWSMEHTAWWRPYWRGYTTRIMEAGLYTEDDAARILDQANRLTVNECKIPVECCQRPAGEDQGWLITSHAHDPSTAV